MSDSATPQPDPAPDANGALDGPVPEPVQPEPVEPAGPGPGTGRSRRGLWAGLAVLCVVLGTLASLFAAHSVAHNDGAKTRAAVQQSSRAIASTLKLAIQRQEELTVAAATFFAANPHATPAEFATWVKWARTQRRYPELDAIGLIPAPAPVVPAPTTASSALPPTSTATAAPGGSSTPAPSAPSSTSTAPVQSAPVPAPAQVSPTLLRSRYTGLSAYTPISAGNRSALAVQTPVYRGNVTPHSVLGRRAASVGWLREVLVPEALMRQVLVGHPGYALSLQYRGVSSNGVAPSRLVFFSGGPASGAQSTAINLHDGWTATSFAAATVPSVFTDEDALALLVAGTILSALLGLLVFSLGAHRPAEGTPVELASPTETEGGAQEELPGQHLYETLTGLPNRALTLDRAERMVARTGRDSGMLSGALFVDIDQLHEVNDKLGPAAGDQLMKIVGERLLDVVRAGDTVGRLDGDEFVVLVESAARGVRLDSLAQRMIEALHKPIELDNFGPSFVLTASIGVAFGRYATPDDLLRDAQLALVSAKAAGKDRYTLFNANMRTIIEGRAVLEAELNTALAEDQFFLLYQPIYDLHSRRVVSLEALIRWRHPEQGVLAPVDFIPLAEETGLIVPIGRFALEEACTRAAAWDVAGDRVGVSVKISPQQLNRDGFITDVRRALQQSGIEPSLLTLAIPETFVMRDIPAATLRLQELKQLGVSIAIDDFGGSGYAHQANLQQMPLDSLRVDRSSLAATEDESYRNWLLEAILVVGRDLSLTVVATGIETAEQMAALQAIGCTMAQGGLLGEAVSVEAVSSLFGVGLATVESGADAGAETGAGVAPSAGTGAGADADAPQPAVALAETGAGVSADAGADVGLEANADAGANAASTADLGSPSLPS
jgi:diguanylate cyclase (GGDEF)-like protein